MHACISFVRFSFVCSVQRVTCADGSRAGRSNYGKSHIMSICNSVYHHGGGRAIIFTSLLVRAEITSCRRVAGE